MTARVSTLLLTVCSLLFAGCASQPAQGGSPPPTAEPAAPAADHPALDVALAHYGAIEADDVAAFEATSWPSTSTQFWWTTGRRYVTDY